MLGVEFEKIKNVTFLIYNEGTFFSKKDLQLHSSFKLELRRDMKAAQGMMKNNTTDNRYHDTDNAVQRGMKEFIKQIMTV